MAQPPIPPSAASLVRTPFWHPDASSYTLIKEIYLKGPDYPYEDIGWHMWGMICDLYFPNVAEVPGGPKWSVCREAYRGQAPGRPPKVRSDVIAIKYSPGPLGTLSEDDARDYLWIECKAASHDKPFGWKDVMVEAVARLANAHPTRDVFLMLAIGWKCAYFIWDPQNTMPAQQQLSFRSTNPNVTWPVDARIKTVGSARWIDTTTGAIDIRQVLELECWTTESVGGQTVPQNRVSLGQIQQFLLHFKNTPLQGFNPM